GPPRTTFGHPLTERPEAAAELVLTLARGEGPTQTRVELTTELVVRESTAPPPPCAPAPRAAAPVASAGLDQGQVRCPARIPGRQPAPDRLPREQLVHDHRGRPEYSGQAAPRRARAQ